MRRAVVCGITSVIGMGERQTDELGKSSTNSSDRLIR
jgi:hypothetical protein